ncbi:MAG: metal ABC transporter substrate-binding protein [Acidimicrobiales bacterium]
MRTVLVRLGVAAGSIGVMLTVTACGSGGGAVTGGTGPRVVVTTSILGDVVRNLVGGAADVQVVMPPGSNPHDFAPSARQAAELRDADVVVINGLGFESALLDTVRAAKHDGATVVTAADGVDVLGRDPHFFTDPVRMRAATAHLAERLAEEVPGLDSPAYRGRVATYLGQLDALDREVGQILQAVPPDRRTLVTNHEVFAYFADRYGFRVLGTVIPSGTTLAEPSASGMRHLADEIAAAGVPAIFAETSSPARLADALAAEGHDVAVVELYSESLGEPGSDGATYLEMLRTDAERIAAALG